MNRDLFKKKSTKVLLSLLAGCFILTSVSGVIFMRNKYNIVMTKNEDIPLRDFYMDLNKERQTQWIRNNNENNLKYLLSPEFLKSFLESRAERLVLQEALNDYEIKFTNEQLLNSVVADSSFYNKENKFDIDIYKNFLKNNAMTEREYFDQLQVSNGINFLHMSFFSNEFFDNDFVNKISTVVNQNRVVDFYKVKKSELKLDNISVEENEIKKYYNDNLKQFIIPEKKKIDFIAIGKDFDANKKLTKEEIKKYYDDNIDLFKIDETYEIYDIKTKDKDKLEKLLKYVKNNKNANIDDIIYNYLPREETEISSKALTAEGLDFLYNKDIKNLKANEYSDIITYNDKFGIVFVKSVAPKTIKSFGEVENIIVNTLKAGKDTKIIENLKNLLLSKKNLNEVADELQLKVENLGTFTREEFKDKYFVLGDNVYNLSLNQFSGIVEADAVYYVYTVSDIENERLLSLVEKHNDIENILRNEKIDKSGKEHLQELIKSGFEGIKYDLTNNVEISRENSKFDKKFIDNIYKINVNDFTDIYTDKDDFYFAVLKRKKTILSHEENYVDTATIKKDLSEGIKKELEKKYLDYLKKFYKTKINYELLKYIQ